MLSSRLPANRSLQRWFWISFVATIVFIIWLKQYLYPLQTAEIVRFEMSKTLDAANGIMEQWKKDNKFQLAINSIYWDYLFIVLYTAAISLGCRFLSSISGNPLLQKTGRFFSILIFVAGVFDVVENIAMTTSLRQSPDTTMISLAYRMAISKFSIVFICLFFVVVCFFSWFFKKIAGEKSFFKTHVVDRES